MYKVIAYFTDGQDNGQPYHVGDTYPREGVKPSAERIKYLLSKNNKRERPLIVEVEEVETAEKTPKKTKRKVKEGVEVPEKPKAKKPRAKKAKE